MNIHQMIQNAILKKLGLILNRLDIKVIKTKQLLAQVMVNVAWLKVLSDEILKLMHDIG